MINIYIIKTENKFTSKGDEICAYINEEEARKHIDSYKEIYYNDLDHWLWYEKLPMRSDISQIDSYPSKTYIIKIKNNGTGKMEDLCSYIEESRAISHIDNYKEIFNSSDFSIWYEELYLKEKFNTEEE